MGVPYDTDRGVRFLENPEVRKEIHFGPTADDGAQHKNTQQRDSDGRPPRPCGTFVPYR